MSQDREKAKKYFSESRESFVQGDYLMSRKVSQETAWVLRVDNPRAKSLWFCCRETKDGCAKAWSMRYSPMHVRSQEWFRDGGYIFERVVVVPKGCKVCREVKGVSIMGPGIFKRYDPNATMWEPI